MEIEDQIKKVQEEGASRAWSFGAAFESFLTDSADDFWYFIMRSLRLVLTIVFHMLALAGLGTAFATGLVLVLGSLMCIGNPSRLNELKEIFQYFFVGAVVGGVSFALNFAIGVPYRYDLRKAGGGIYKCWRCSVLIPDHMFCQFCGIFRPGRLATIPLKLAAGAVGVLFMLYDATIMAIDILYATSGRKK
jgi:hypothetical protein